MEIKKILFRREMKLVTLLLTSILIASASAAVYYSMTFRSTSTVAVAPVYFKDGDDSTGIVNYGSNSTYASLTLNAYPNATSTYEQAVNITATADKQVQLRHSSISPPNNDPRVSNFTSIAFTLIRRDGSSAGSLTYATTGDVWTLPTGPTGYQTINSGQQWTIKIEIKAAPNANTGIAVTIDIYLDVE